MVLREGKVHGNRLGKPLRNLKYTNEDVVGFKLEAEPKGWDNPTKNKHKLFYDCISVIKLAIWLFKKEWYSQGNKRGTFKFKYELYQYDDFILYFNTLVLLRGVLKDEVGFTMPYKLGTLKMYKYKGVYYGKKAVVLNLHSLRFKYYFKWYKGSIPMFKLYRFYRRKGLMNILYHKLVNKYEVMEYFFAFVPFKRRGRWINTPKRDVEKLKKLLTDNYGVTNFKTNIERLGRRQRPNARTAVNEPAKTMGD